MFTNKPDDSAPPTVKLATGPPLAVTNRYKWTMEEEESYVTVILLSVTTV